MKQAGRKPAQKRGQMVVKLVREIMVAAKLGGADPDTNARLAGAMEKARKSSVTPTLSSAPSRRARG
jgi:transcriptional/translational regulatory protein YebC/TACO1